MAGFVYLKFGTKYLHVESPYNRSTYPPESRMAKQFSCGQTSEGFSSGPALVIIKTSPDKISYDVSKYWLPNTDK